jgi:hypothetical protein
MPSTFTWIDPSDAQRQRLLSAIDKFKESDTRDELGLGSIRDGLADYFFPGTSVLMTRARYFLFTPWLYQELEAKRVVAAKVEAKARDAEVALILALMASGEKVGVIGNVAQKSLKRLPSSVYWLGVGAWGIRQYDGLQSDYHAAFDRLRDAASSAVRDDDGSALERVRATWHRGIPSPPDDFPAKANLVLTREEATYLADRIQHACGSSLLAYLARDGRPAEVDFVWEHPQSADFPAPVREMLAHGQNLAESMQGAAWLYNLLLAEARAKTGGGTEAVEMFRDRCAAWAEEVGQHDAALSAWSLSELWHRLIPLANVKTPTKQFVEAWVAARPWRRADGGAGDDMLRKLVARREEALKGARSRLRCTRALELWGGQSGTGRLDYRWTTASRLLTDVYEALGRGGRHASAA